MIHLGYGKYWRSDNIVGLLPIEEDRGPGRRTEVWVGRRGDPIIASRSQGAILRDMASLPDEARAAALSSAVEEFVDVMKAMSPVLKRVMQNEGRLDTDSWVRRFEGILGPVGIDENQNELFD